MIDREMAWVIMGGLDVAYAEGLDGIPSDADGNFCMAESRLVRMLHEKYPDVVEYYSHLPVVRTVLQT